MHSDTPAPPPANPYSPPEHPGSPEALQVAGGDVVPAGFIRRWAALFLDQLILSVPLVVLVFGLGVAMGLGAAQDPGTTSLMTLLFYPAYFVAAAVYYAAMESSAGQATLGKRALGIKVTDMDGRRLSFGHALGRWFAAALSYLSFYIGFLMAAFTERKRALHDYVAGTQVVDQWAYTGFPERQKRGLSGCLVAFLIAMLMVPVLAILAAISISQYQDYVLRSQVQEGLALSNGVKQAVAAYASRNGGFPASNAAAGLPAPAQITGAYVGAVDVGAAPGQIVVTYGTPPASQANVLLQGKQLRFVGELAGGSIRWTCVSEDLKQKHCPSSCDCSG